MNFLNSGYAYSNLNLEFSYISLLYCAIHFNYYNFMCTKSFYYFRQLQLSGGQVLHEEINQLPPDPKLFAIHAHGHVFFKSTQIMINFSKMLFLILVIFSASMKCPIINSISQYHREISIVARFEFIAVKLKKLCLFTFLVALWIKQQIQSKNFLQVI